MKAIQRFTKSSSFVVGITFTLMMMTGVYFVAYFIVIGNDDTLLKESEAAIISEATLFKQIHKLGGANYLSKLLQQRLEEPNNQFFYGLKLKNSQDIAGNLNQWPQPEVIPSPETLFSYEIDHNYVTSDTQSVRPMSEHYDLMALVLVLDEGHQLLIGRNVDDLEIAQFVSSTFGWLMVGILLMVSAISFLVGFYVVSRINRIADTATQIVDTGNLSARIPIDSNWDDLSKLSEVLNRMLSELEDMVQGVKSVSDNIAHDLRTPITRLRGDIEQLDDPENKLKLLQEVDNILSIFNGLLRIADIEAEKQKRAFKDNDIAIIVEDVVDLYGALAEAKSIKLEYETQSGWGFCDRDLLFQAFANILDNAIKFTPDGGTVSVKLKRHTTHWMFSVCDTGAGIPELDREKVTQRFFRLDESRSTKGNGLGLALVAAIVALHQGTLRFENNDCAKQLAQGVCCTVELPIA